MIPIDSSFRAAEAALSSADSPSRVPEIIGSIPISGADYTLRVDL